MFWWSAVSSQGASLIIIVSIVLLPTPWYMSTCSCFSTLVVASQAQHDKQDLPSLSSALTWVCLIRFAYTLQSSSCMQYIPCLAAQQLSEHRIQNPMARLMLYPRSSPCIQCGCKQSDCSCQAVGFLWGCSLHSWVRCFQILYVPEGGNYGCEQLRKINCRQREASHRVSLCWLARGLKLQRTC